MAIDLAKLSAQGRAFSGTRPWTPEELEAVILISTERQVERTIAANYVRNGILTLEDYDKAVEAEFSPKTLNDVVVDVETALKDNDFATAPAEEKVEEEAAPARRGRKPKAEAEDAPAEEDKAE